MAQNQDPILPYEEGYDSGRKNPAFETRRDNDTVKTPEVNLYTIDYSIIYHLTNSVKLRVVENDTYIEVPVIYADSEKWVQFRERGYIRDREGKMMAPIVGIRRTNVEKDPRLPMLDLNNYKPALKYFPYRQMYERYDRFGDQSNRKPSYELYFAAIPDYVRVSYDLVVWARTMVQLNTIVQTVLSTSDHLWGDYWKFRTNAVAASNNTTNNAGEDRVVSATIQLTVDGFLMEPFEYQESTMQKMHSIKTVRMLNEQEELGIYIQEPYFKGYSQHMSNEQYDVLQKNMHRNPRFR